jgi:hypothetical protein
MSATRGFSQATMVLAAVLVAGCSGDGSGAAPAPQRPDLSGWWELTLATGRFPSPFIDAPFNPELAPVMAGMTAAYEAAVLPDPVALGAKPQYCHPPFFSGFNGGFENSIEFLQTPGRVTITNEGGLIRRVELDQPLPADPVPSRQGTAVGHWEGEVLVIETRGLRADNPLYFTPFMIGDAVHVVERVRLTGPDTLEIALSMTAPDLFSRPFETKLAYRRDRTHEYQEYSVCEQDDRSIDPGTGRQRFELTPPPDLPPPPPG